MLPSKLLPNICHYHLLNSQQLKRGSQTNLCLQNDQGTKSVYAGADVKFSTALPLHQWSSLALGALKGSLHGLGESCCPETNINPHEYLHAHYFFSWFLMKLLFAWCWLPNLIHSKFFKNHKLFCMIYPSRSPN